MMDIHFKLEKDIIFFDIEATGLNVIKDRIVQLAMVKYTPDNPEPIEWTSLINPGAVLISEEAFAVHGISSAMVANKPTFEQRAAEIFAFIGDADLAGYNSDRYDIPMLMEELGRQGFMLDLSKRRTIDVQKIFYKMEPRTLSAAYKLYCNKHIENAHDALADVRATVEVLKGQIKKYEGVDHIDGDGYTTPSPIKNDMTALSEFTHDKRMIDATMRFKRSPKGEIVFNFGKYSGQNAAQVLKNDKQYYNWILDKDFSIQVKQIVKALVAGTLA